MGLFGKIFSELICKRPANNNVVKPSKVFYKIVDFSEKEKYILQCINTSAIFSSSIIDIVFDIDILYGLHPIQACYIGIEYAKYIKKIDVSLLTQNKVKHNLNKQSYSKHGTFTLCYENRQGNLCFVDKKTNMEFIMDARDIAFSKELISEFDVPQAFYIGLLAGIKINNSTVKIESVKSKGLSLRILK